MRAHAQNDNTGRKTPSAAIAGLATLLAATPLILGGCWGASTAPAEDADTREPRSVYALGALQPTSGVISVSGTPGDRLKALDPDVEEGQPAPANGVLGLMASYDAQSAQLDALRDRKRMAEEKHRVDELLASANARAAEAQVKEAEAKQAEAGLQEDQLGTLRESAAIAREEYETLKNLRETDADLVTEHQLRKQANELARVESEVRLATRRVQPMAAAADAALEAARANLEAARVRLESLKNRPEVDAIEQEIDVATEALARSVVWAPHADRSQLDEQRPLQEGDPPGRYTVLQVMMRPGEAATQLPVLKLADLSEIECVAEVYEAEVKFLHIGQGATITSPAFSEPFSDGLRGEVAYISNVVTSPGLNSRNPLAPQDRSVVEVRVRLDLDNEAALAEAARRIGLQVTVRFDPPDDTDK